MFDSQPCLGLYLCFMYFLVLVFHHIGSTVLRLATVEGADPEARSIAILVAAGKPVTLSLLLLINRSPYLRYPPPPPRRRHRVGRLAVAAHGQHHSGHDR